MTSVDCHCHQSSVDTALTHSGAGLGLSCTVLVESRDQLSDEKQIDASETASNALAFSNR